MKSCDSVPHTDPARMAAANQQFHQTVWRASRNESLIDLLGRLHLHLGRYPGTTLASPGHGDAAREEHRQLFDAIDRRDGDEAHRIAMGHFRAARDIRLDLFAREASLFK